MNKKMSYLKPILAFIFVLSICSGARANNFENNAPPDLMRDFNILRAKLNSNPRDIPTINSLGIIYAKSGKLEDAIKIWKYGLSIDSSYIHLYNNLGSAYKQMGRKDDARLVFRAGLAISSSYWIYYNLGLLEKEEGNYGQAYANFMECLKKKPGFQPAISKLSEMGYHVQIPTIDKTEKLMSFGSYKPPVESGNIGLHPLIPNTYGSQNTYQKSQTPSVAKKFRKKSFEYPIQPLTVASCSQIIASFNAKPNEKFVAVTFDDGPHHTFTNRLLDIMKAENIKGTFFVVGSRAETYPDIITRMAIEGHDVGNHSWQHKSLTKLSDKLAMATLQRTADLISGITSKPCKFVRPPFGHTNTRIENLIHRQGWHQVMWDSDSRDWEIKDPSKVLYKVMRSVTPGSIILFHDIHPGVLTVLPTLIKAFKANGYKFVTMTEMAKLAEPSS